MARLLGIDVTKATVRAAVVRTSYRRVTLEAFGEADIAWTGSEVEAVRAAVGGWRAEACAIAVSGERSFYRRIELPAAAQREIENVLGFELEATVPFEMDSAVFDYRTLRPQPGGRPRGPDEPAVIPVFAVLARTEDVRARITLLREALGIEPERIGSGPLPLANLMSVMPELERPTTPGPLAILDVGEHTAEIVVLLDGEAVFARTLSRGTAGLPASAHTLARELRQTLAAWRSQGGAPLQGVYLVGVGASATGAEVFLSTELGVTLLPLPRPRLEGLTPEQTLELPRFAKALGLALGLAGRAKAHNLRRGALEAERSYPYLREKIPMLSGLAAVIAVSFGFSAVAEVRALDAEREMLGARLVAASRDVLGEDISEPEKAKELLEPGTGKVDEDPLPRVDGFDVMVQLSKAVPSDVVHDVLDFDVQRGKVTLQGVVPTVGDAETIAKNMRENRCFKSVNVGRTSVFGDNKQKYTLEFEFKCEEPKKKPKAAAEPEGSAQPAAGAGDRAPGPTKPDKTEGTNK
jgi:general secretion pathway protein L